MLRLWKMGVALVGTMTLGAMMAGSAWGETATVCVPEAPSKPVVTPNAKGECPPKGKKLIKYKLVEMGEGKEGPEGKEGKAGVEGKAGAEGKEGPEGKNAFTAEQLTLLKSILPHLSFVEAGVGGKPTIRFSGVNLQLLSGAGKTNAAVNGEGNLVIGYDEKPGAQTGSHNLVLGVEQAYTSFGSLIAGERNTDSAPFSDVFGVFNTASGEYASVAGGFHGTAGGEFSSVSGGVDNVAGGNGASVSGGAGNKASGLEASATGGQKTPRAVKLRRSAAGFRMSPTQETRP